MMMLEEIKNISELVAALTVIFGALMIVPKHYAGLKVKENVSKTHEDEQDEEITKLGVSCKNIKQEQAVICKSLLACLDGLHQLGANGKVTKSLNELEEYINNSAHNQ
jgi:hypothetical protein